MLLLATTSNLYSDEHVSECMDLVDASKKLSFLHITSRLVQIVKQATSRFEIDSMTFRNTAIEFLCPDLCARCGF